MKKLFYLLLLILILLSAGGVWLFLNAEQLAQDKIKTALKDTAFKDLSYETISIGTKETTLKNIKLDKNGINTIDSISFSYTPLGILLEHKIKDVHVQKISVTAEWLKDGRLDIPGWSGNKTPLPAKNALNKLPFDNLILEDLQIDLGTEYGALRLDMKGDVRKKPNGDSETRLSLWGKQNQLSFNVKSQINMLTTGKIEGKVELSDLRLESDDLTISRTNGWIDFILPDLSGKAMDYTGTINVGGLKYQDHSFVNTTLTLDNKNHQITAIMRSNPAGYEDLHIALDWQNNALSASLSSNNSTSVYNFITQHKNEPPKILKKVQNISIDLKMDNVMEKIKGHNLPLLYNISINDGNLIFSGDGIFYKDNMTFSSKLDKTVIPLSSLKDFLPYKPLGGDIIVDGTLNIAKNSIKGPMRLSLKEASLEKDSIQARHINTWMILNSLYPLEHKGSNVIEIGELESGIVFKDLNARYHLDKNGILRIKKAQTDFSGGTISVSPFTIPQKKQDYIVHLEHIDLNDLVHIAGLNDIVLEGNISGVIPLSIDKGAIVIHQATLKNDTAGLIQYKPKEYPAALSGSDHRINTLRLALDNFAYNELELEASGPISENMDAKLIAHGKSPLFGERPVHINLNLEGAIGPVIQRTLQNGALGTKLP